MVCNCKFLPLGGQLSHVCSCPLAIFTGFVLVRMCCSFQNMGIVYSMQLQAWSFFRINFCTSFCLDGIVIVCRNEIPFIHIALQTKIFWQEFEFSLQIQMQTNMIRVIFAMIGKWKYITWCDLGAGWKLYVDFRPIFSYHMTASALENKCLGYRVMWCLPAGRSLEICQDFCHQVTDSGGPYELGRAASSQWNPKYGCKGTVTTRFALIALVAWQYKFDSTLKKLFVHPKYGWNSTVSRVFPLIALIALGAFFHSTPGSAQQLLW